MKKKKLSSNIPKFNAMFNLFFSSNFPANYQVRVGAHHKWLSGTVISVDYRVVHSSYNRRLSHDNDIALVHLETPLTFDQEHIQPICLPDANFPEVETCTVTGWGAPQDRKWLLLTHYLTPLIYNCLLSC